MTLFSWNHYGHHVFNNNINAIKDEKQNEELIYKTKIFKKKVWLCLTGEGLLAKCFKTFFTVNTFRVVFCLIGYCWCAWWTSWCSSCEFVNSYQCHEHDAPVLLLWWQHWIGMSTLHCTKIYTISPYVAGQIWTGKVCHVEYKVPGQKKLCQHSFIPKTMSIWY